MINKFASIKDAMTQAVRSLGPDRSFNLGFCTGRGAAMMSESGPIPVTESGRRKAAKFLDDGFTSGIADMDKCLDAAFNGDPDLIYLVSDGDMAASNGAVVNRARELTRHGQVRINTIALISDKDTDTQFIDALKVIARESNGSFRLVREDQLHQ